MYVAVEEHSGKNTNQISPTMENAITNLLVILILNLHWHGN